MNMSISVIMTVAMRVMGMVMMMRGRRRGFVSLFVLFIISGKLDETFIPSSSDMTSMRGPKLMSMMSTGKNLIISVSSLLFGNSRASLECFAFSSLVTQSLTPKTRQNSRLFERSDSDDIFQDPIVEVRSCC